jgi:DNA-binding winged helix-turn-helix (wHTH) protein
MRVRFGDVEVDGDTRQIRRAGRGVHLSPKAFDLLTLLLSRRPAAVPKSEIHDRLWAGTFVSDTSLPTLVAEVRDAIGDDAKRMHYVRTIHRFGYAFQGDVSEIQPAIEAESIGAWLVGAAARIGMARGEHVLGREGHGIVALDSPTISRRHARVSVEADGATVEDLGSKNGTFVNDTRVTAPVRVADGDTLRVGDLVFTFRLSRPGTTTQTI